MNNQTQLDTLFSERGIWKGKELLLTHRVAVDYLEECRNRNITIIGADFLIVDRDEITLLNNAIDFSEISESEKSAEKTYKLIRNIIGNAFPDNATHITFILQ